VKQIIEKGKKKNVGIFSSVIHWFSIKNECKFAVDCKKGARLNQTKLLKKSSICHQREWRFFERFGHFD